MKPRIVFQRGFWWCYRMGVTGQGKTPKEAYDDMLSLYRQAVQRKPQGFYTKPRFA